MRRRRKSNVRRRVGKRRRERERRSDEAVGAVVPEACNCAQCERDESRGGHVDRAVVQQATVPSAREMRDEAMGAVA